MVTLIPRTHWKVKIAILRQKVGLAKESLKKKEGFINRIEITKHENAAPQ
jgi:hypothetical protein